MPARAKAGGGIGRSLVAAVAIGLVAGGCVEEFVPGSVVERPRILAVRSDPAEVAPGEGASLSALVADSGPSAGLPGSLRLDWALCLATQTSAQDGPVPDVCSDPVLDPALDPATFAAAMPGLDPTVPYTPTLPAAELLGLEVTGPPDSSGGLYLPVRVVLVGPDGPLDVAVHRLRLRTGEGEPNQNPELAEGGLLLDGTAWEAMDEPEVGATGTLALAAAFAEGSAEHYRAALPGAEPVEGDELVSFFWFTEGGLVDPDVTGGAGRFDTAWKLGEGPAPALPGARVRLWVVLRDGRGGTAWAERAVRIVGGSPR